MHKFSETLFQNAIDLNDTIVFEYDIDNDVIDFSDNIERYVPIANHITGFVSKLGSYGKIHRDDVKKMLAFLTSVNNLGKVRMEYIRLLDFAGNYKWYQLKGRLDRRAGAPNMLYGTISYIDDETKKFDDAQNTLKDRLTRLLNKETFVSQLGEYIAGAPKEVISNVMIISIDDYEDIKETQGEIALEGLVLDVSRLLKKTFRGSDLICRLDEESFGVLMKGVRSFGVMLERAAFVRQSVKEVSKDTENTIGATVSIGIAAIKDKKPTCEELFKKAEAALADAKNSGKDNYVLYTDDSGRMDTSINPVLNSKEMELVKNILDPMFTWAYAVDENYQLLYRNSILSERLGNRNNGLCYVQNKGYTEPCPDCPLAKMSDKDTIFDTTVYSTSLRVAVPTRTNKITMRDGKNVYIVASVRENIENQIEAIDESEDRIHDAIYTMQDIIWDVNITKNTCVRLKEKNIKSVMNLRIENYQNLRNQYLQTIVHPEDINQFCEATEPRYIKQEIKLGNSLVCREVRLKNIDDEYQWYNLYTVILNTDSEEMTELGFMKYSEVEDDDIRCVTVALNVNDYKKRSIETIETKTKYEIMKQKSDILKDMELNLERDENVNEMVGILVYEYTTATNSYYLCTMFDEYFKVDRKELTDGWSLLRSIKVHEDDQEIMDRFIEGIQKGESATKTTVRLYNKNGAPIWYTITVQALRGLNNEVVRYLGTLQNVNTEMEIKAEMEYRADYDSLTGLYNSNKFYRKADEIIHMNPEQKYVIIAVDIEKFRLINDRYGIEMGNRTLAALGKTIREVASRSTIGKRYQADIFSVLFPYETEQDIITYINQLSSRMAVQESLPTAVSLVYGIYKIVDRDVPIRLMCDRARSVKRQVKGSVFTNYAVYDDVIRLKDRERAEIEEEMEDALRAGEFEMFLQPQVNLKDRVLCGAEALVRWRHPIKGVLVPAQFLDLFESNGFITKMDKFVWEEACKYLSELKARNIDIPISVNISRAHVGNTALAETLEDLVKQYDIEPSRLELEITENLFIGDVDELFAQMDELKKRGFKILMDDFGSGYSSLNMLKTAPVDILKIDRFFLDEIMVTDRGKIIVESSIKMAKQLGLNVIAEGVETEEQFKFLRNVDCDIAQGYYFSRPIPISEFEIFLERTFG